MDVLELLLYSFGLIMASGIFVYTAHIELVRWRKQKETYPLA